MECCLCLNTTSESVVTPCDCAFYKVHVSCLPDKILYCYRCKVHYDSNGRHDVHPVNTTNIVNFQDYVASEPTVGGKRHDPRTGIPLRSLRGNARDDSRNVHVTSVSHILSYSDVATNKFYLQKILFNQRGLERTVTLDWYFQADQHISSRL